MTLWKQCLLALLRIGIGLTMMMTMDEKLMDGRQHFDDDDNDMINRSINRFIDRSMIGAGRDWERENIVDETYSTWSIVRYLTLLVGDVEGSLGGTMHVEKKSLHSTYVGIQRVKYFYETSSTNFYHKSSRAKLENRWVGINHTRRKSRFSDWFHVGTQYF